MSIDHLGNRRVRSVGELLQNQFRIGFSRMERVIRERMTLQTQETDVITPQSARSTSARSWPPSRSSSAPRPLSQFMDQNNPLAELTHKRRLSALGPGGLSRDRAGFEVRDVHYTHYGRMCPIETPEGPNIGLISYLATFAKINKYGFVEAPYRKVDKATGTVTDEVVYMTADVEDEYIVAQANEPLDENDHFVRPRVSGRSPRRRSMEFDAAQRRLHGRFCRVRWLSVATAMHPVPRERRLQPCPDGLEHAASGRAAARHRAAAWSPPAWSTRPRTDSGVCVLAAHDGVVECVDADKIMVRYGRRRPPTPTSSIKFMRSNQGTCINQRPIVNVGETRQGRRRAGRRPRHHATARSAWARTP